MDLPVELVGLLKHAGINGKKLTWDLQVNSSAISVKLMWIKAVEGSFVVVYLGLSAFVGYGNAVVCLCFCTSFNVFNGFIPFRLPLAYS
jgi:hypothetical protein